MYFSYISSCYQSAVARRDPYVISVGVAVKQPKVQPHVCIVPSSPALHFDLCGYFSCLQGPQKDPTGDGWLHFS